MSSIIRWLAILGIAAALVWVCFHHEHGGVKGRYVPIPNIAVCIVLAAVTAFLCKLNWRPVAAPFVAGITGVFGIGVAFCGPYGGVVGLLVGLLVVLTPLGTDQLMNRRS